MISLLKFTAILGFLISSLRFVFHIKSMSDIKSIVLAEIKHTEQISKSNNSKQGAESNLLEDKNYGSFFAIIIFSILASSIFCNTNIVIIGASIILVILTPYIVSLLTVRYISNDIILCVGNSIMLTSIVLWILLIIN